MTTGCSLDAGRDRVHTGLASSFDAYGRFVARNPVKVIAASFSLFVIMCTGLIRLTPEYRYTASPCLQLVFSARYTLRAAP